MFESGEVIIENLEEKFESCSLGNETANPLLITKQKLFMWVTVILLEKVLFKSSLFVHDLCLLIKDIFLSIQIVMRMPLLCLLRN